MRQNPKVQLAIMLVALYGWNQIIDEGTNNGRTLSNEDEDCYVNLNEDEYNFVTSEYPKPEMGEEQLADTNEAEENTPM